MATCGLDINSKKTKLKRPMNAFLMFCKERRSTVRESNPQLDNRSVTRILGNLWVKLDPDSKIIYMNAAKQVKHVAWWDARHLVKNKEEFLKANPDHKWYRRERALQKPFMKQHQASSSVVSDCSSACVRADENPSRSGLGLLLMAGQMAVIPQTVNPNLPRTHLEKQDVIPYEDDTPMDLSLATTTLKSDKQFVTSNQSSVTSISQQPTGRQSDLRLCNVNMLNGSETTVLQLVSSMFDSLISSSYDTSVVSANNDSLIRQSVDRLPRASLTGDSEPTKFVQLQEHTRSSSSCLQATSAFPKTKKQLAVQQIPEVLNFEKLSKADEKGLTLGEIQENIITNVVTNDCLSRLLEGNHSARQSARASAGHAGDCKDRSCVSNEVTSDIELKVGCQDSFKLAKATVFGQQETAKGPSCKIPNITRRPLSQSDINRFIEQVITNSDNTLTAGYSQSPAANTRSCHLSHPAATAIDEASCCKFESKPEVYSNKSENITTLVEVASVVSQHEKSCNNGSADGRIDNKPYSRDSSENLSAMENLNVLCNAVETDVPYVADEVEMCTSMDDNIVPIRNLFLEESAHLVTCAVSPEINNNHQLNLANVTNARAGSTVEVKSVTSKCGLRKSKRCNRGQRYQELVSNGSLHHARKRDSGLDGELPLSQSVCGRVDSTKPCVSVRSRLSDPSSPKTLTPTARRHSIKDDQESCCRTRLLNICEMRSALQRRLHAAIDRCQRDHMHGSQRRKPLKAFILHYHSFAVAKADSETAVCGL